MTYLTNFSYHIMFKNPFSSAWMESTTTWGVSTERAQTF